MSHPPPSPPASPPVVPRRSAIMESGSDTVGFAYDAAPVGPDGVPLAIAKRVRQHSRRSAHTDGCTGDVHLRAQSVTSLAFRCACEGVVIYVGLN